jgi:hypothetical protein
VQCSAVQYLQEAVLRSSREERRGEEHRWGHGLVAALHQVAACRVAEGQCVSRPDPRLDGSVPACLCP